jgi:hypothetical protein
LFLLSPRYVYLHHIVFLADTPVSAPGRVRLSAHIHPLTIIEYQASLMDHSARSPSFILHIARMGAAPMSECRSRWPCLAINALGQIWYHHPAHFGLPLFLPNMSFLYLLRYYCPSRPCAHLTRARHPLHVHSAISTPFPRNCRPHESLNSSYIVSAL